MLESIKKAKNLKNKRVLVRADFDVPLIQEGKKSTNQKNKAKVADDSRLRKLLPTIEYLLEKKAKIILIGHAGRPGDKVVPALSLKPVAEYLEKDLRLKNKDLSIKFIDNISDFKNNENITMLENLRFSDRERANCKRFARKLASLADIYVNEAFANSHRAHASVDAIQSFLPSYIGLNLEQEIKNLSAITQKSQKPVVLIIGGAKVETKLPVIEKFIPIADHILVGGVVANTFLKSLGYKTGKSLVNDNYLNQANRIINKTENSDLKIQSKFKIQNLKLILPTDIKAQSGKICSANDISQNSVALDLGPKTISNYIKIIKSAKTIIWNGPMGKLEQPPFDHATKKIANAILKSNAKAVIGGGDTDEILKGKKIPSNIFVSSGGGAMLEFLAGKKLPGIK